MTLLLFTNELRYEWPWVCRTGGSSKNPGGSIICPPPLLKWGEQIFLSVGGGFPPPVPMALELIMSFLCSCARIDNQSSFLLTVLFFSGSGFFQNIQSNKLNKHEIIVNQIWKNHLEWQRVLKSSFDLDDLTWSI